MFSFIHLTWNNELTQEHPFKEGLCFTRIMNRLLSAIGLISKTSDSNPRSICNGNVTYHNQSKYYHMQTKNSTKEGIFKLFE